jgi:hypothetical protein
MRIFPFVACLCAAASCATLHASILPTVRLDPQAVQEFDKYVAQFQRDVVVPYEQTGKMWIDSSTCCVHKAAFASGKPVLEPRENTDIVGPASIHHFSGVMHIAGGTIEKVRRVMQDYVNYPKYFKPDIGRGSAEKLPDSTPEDEHFRSNLSIIENTLWIAVSYDSVYDSHYRFFGPHRWESISSAVSIKEWRDPKDVKAGYLPEGNDHGFLWRTNTFWFVRESEGGIDLELDSMTLSRPVPSGFGWWGTKRTHDAVEKMMRDMKTAVEAIR